MAGNDDQPKTDAAESGLDSWSVALSAYFVALIVVVAGLLVLPALY